MRREWEKQWKDPDDVFFEARDRKQEIRERIKELQRGLDLMKPKPKEKSRKSIKPTH